MGDIISIFIMVSLVLIYFYLVDLIIDDLLNDQTFNKYPEYILKICAIFWIIIIPIILISYPFYAKRKNID